MLRAAAAADSSCATAGAAVGWSCNLAPAKLGSLAGNGAGSAAAGLACLPVSCCIRCSLALTFPASSTIRPLPLKSTLPLSWSVSAVILFKFACVCGDPSNPPTFLCIFS